MALRGIDFSVYMVLISWMGEVGYVVCKRRRVRSAIDGAWWRSFVYSGTSVAVCGTLYGTVRFWRSVSRYICGHLLLYAIYGVWGSAVVFSLILYTPWV